MVFASDYSRPHRSLEPDAHAHDDRERQAGAVVIDAFETGSNELIHYRQAAHVAQPELCGDIDLLRDRKDDAAAEAPGERGRLIVEIVAVEDRIRLRRRELHVDA